MSRFSPACTAFLALSLFAGPSAAQSQAPPADPRSSSVAARSPARSMGIPTVPSFPSMPSPATRLVPNYGRLLQTGTYGFALGVAIGRADNEASGLRQFASGFPQGKKIHVDVVYDDFGFRRILGLHQPDGWLFNRKPKDHVRTLTILGSDRAQAEELGYRCNPLTCVSPELEAELHERLRGACLNTAATPDGAGLSQTGRAIGPDPAACAPDDDIGRRPGSAAHVLSPENADSSTAWADAVYLLMSDANAHTSHAIRTAGGTAHEAAARRADMTNLRDAMGLARTALEVADPELARHVDVIGTAAFSMHDALERFTSLPVGADGTLASLALGANVANIGLMLAGEFMDSGDSGPSSDDLIFEQLVQLRQQVQELREELHERFDRVHEQLDAMYATLVDGLDVLLRRDDLRYASVMSSLENGRRQLTEIARVQLDTQAIVIDQFTFLEDLVTDLALSECEAPPHVINDDGGEQHQQWFQRCRFAMMSIHRSLPGRQLRPESRTTISERLETHPDRMIAFQYESFRRFLAATGPEGVARATAMSSRTPTVGPDVWYSLIDLHDGFLVAYPELAARDPQFLEDGIVPNQFSRAMQRWRGHLLGFADTIREELRAFQDEARPTVFSQLLEDVWDRGRFDSLLRSLGDPIELLWNCMGSGAGASEDCAVLQDLGSSHHVRRLLLGDPGATSYATCGSARQDFQDLQRRMAIGDLHLRNWLALAFRSDVGRSETVTALAAGWVGLPDLCRMMKEYDLDFASWPAVLDVIEFHVGELQRVLRSASMREAARSELVHPILTDVRYPSLGDVPLAHVLP